MSAPLAPETRPAPAAGRFGASAGAAGLSSLKALIGAQRTTLLLCLDGPKTAGQVAEALQTVPGGATHHLCELEAAGLVFRMRRGRQVLVERTARGSALLGLYCRDDAR
jgi:DNA-binding transcriptional ArsR family regulator